VLKDVGQRRREATLHRAVAAVKQGHFYSAENGTDENRNTKNEQLHEESRVEGLRLDAENTPEGHVLKGVGQRRREAALEAEPFLKTV
jgi:hypothetical protein